MHVCFCTPQLPFPPEQGAAIRNYNLLRFLTRDHQVTLASITPLGTAIPEELRSLCDRVIVGPAEPRPVPLRLAQQLRVQPDLALRVRSPRLSRMLARLAEQAPWDVVQVEGLEMLPNVSNLPARRLVLDEHNAEFMLQRSAARSDAALRRWTPALYSLVQTIKLAAFEGRACRRADAVTAVSDQDATALRRIAPTATIDVVPNGVDTARYCPNETESANASAPPVLLFTGKMDFRPNVEGIIWFARQVLPRIWTTAPDTRLTIFGMNPTHEVRILA